MYKVNHGWLYGNVKPYFASVGITLLKDDMLFIEQCLSSIPTERHRHVMRDYLSIWNATVAGKENKLTKAFNPRFEANTYLRSASGNHTTRATAD